MMKQTQETAARSALDTLAYALHPGLDGGKRAELVNRTLAFLTDQIGLSRRNPHVELAQPPLSGEEQARNTPVVLFVQTVLDYMGEAAAFGQIIDESVAGSAVLHGKVTLRGRIPTCQTVEDLIAIRTPLASAEGKRFRLALMRAPGWEQVTSRWNQIETALSVGNREEALLLCGLAKAPTNVPDPKKTKKTEKAKPKKAPAAKTPIPAKIAAKAPPKKPGVPKKLAPPKASAKKSSKSK